MPGQIAPLNSRYDGTTLYLGLYVPIDGVFLIAKRTVVTGGYAFTYAQFPGEAEYRDAFANPAGVKFEAMVQGAPNLAVLCNQFAESVAASGSGAPASTVAVSNFPASTAVTGTVSVGNFPSFPATQAVSGTVTVANPTAAPETGLAKDATFAKDADGGIKVHLQNPVATQPVSGSVSVANLPTTQAVSGTVAVSNFPAAATTIAVSNLPATQPVSGSVSVSNLPATQAVSGPLTDGQLRASAVPVSGTFYPPTQAVSATALPLPTGAAQDGTDITTPTAMPTGGSGIRGWLSAIWTKLNGSLAVTGTFWPATQPVSGSVTVSNLPATQAVSGTVTANTGLAQPVTDAQLRATALPVSGTFYQATQPVSIAAMPTTPVTGTFFQATQPVSGTVTANTGLSQPLTDTQLRATALPVSLTFPTTQAVSMATAPTTPVTGTFWQSTQPVSGPLTDTQLRATSLPVTVTFPATQAISGTVGVNNFPATQAVSGTVAVSALPALPAGSNAIGTVTVGNFPATQPVSLATNTPTLAQGTNSIGTVQQAALTKGTQGATGVTTQDLKDAGRTPVTYYSLIPVLATATDTLQSLTGTKGGATVAATATPAVVTTGKTLRIQRLWATYIATATTGYGLVRLRYNPAGVAALTSPVLLTLAIGSSAPVTANSAASEDAPVPDGLELASGAGLGISVQGFAAATPAAVGYVLVGVSGYEY